MRYRKKPVVIEARQVGNDYDEVFDILAWCGGSLPCLDSDVLFYIPTLEGSMAVMPGDYVIKGVKGEFYPCKPDIFKATYDEAEGL